MMCVYLVWSGHQMQPFPMGRYTADEIIKFYDRMRSVTALPRARCVPRSPPPAPPRLLVRLNHHDVSHMSLQWPAPPIAFSAVDAHFKASSRTPLTLWHCALAWM